MDAAPGGSVAATWWRTLLVRWTERRLQKTYRKLVSSLPESTLGDFIEPIKGGGRTAPQRAVPIAVEPLTAALDKHPNARGLFRHLVIVEQTLRLAKGDPFSFVPPAVLDQAIKQLEIVGDFGAYPGLRLLHLQMRRRQCENEARAQAEAEGRVTRWDPRQASTPEARMAAARERVEMNGWTPGPGPIAVRVRREVVCDFSEDIDNDAMGPVPFQDTLPFEMQELPRRAAGGHQ